MNEAVSPILDLHEPIGPSLSLPPSDLAHVMTGSGTPMALGMLSAIKTEPLAPAAIAV